MFIVAVNARRAYGKTSPFDPSWTTGRPYDMNPSPHRSRVSLCLYEPGTNEAVAQWILITLLRVPVTFGNDPTVARDGRHQYRIQGRFPRIFPNVDE